MEVKAMKRKNCLW